MEGVELDEDRDENLDEDRDDDRDDDHLILQRGGGINPKDQDDGDRLLPDP